jgi:VRR-NUC domain
MSGVPDLFGRQLRDANAEARIQASIVAWARLVAPDALTFAIPNGGVRTKAEAARLKWTGVLAGIPDLAIIAAGRRVFFIEVKAPGGSLSADQREIRDFLTALGTPPAICRSIDDARRAFANWGISTREAHDGR